MKTLGLLGGMSWESTAIYYRLLNEIVRERLAGCIRQSCCCGRSTLPRSPSVSIKETGTVPACFSKKPRASSRLGAPKA